MSGAPPPPRSCRPPPPPAWTMAPEDEDKGEIKPVSTIVPMPLGMDYAHNLDISRHIGIVYLSRTAVTIAGMRRVTVGDRWYSAFDMMPEATLTLIVRKHIFTDDSNTKLKEQKSFLSAIQAACYEALQLELDHYPNLTPTYTTSDVGRWKGDEIDLQAMLLSGKFCQIKEECIVKEGIATGGKVIAEGRLCFCSISKVLLFNDTKKAPFLFSFLEQSLRSGKQCIEKVTYKGE